MRSPAKSAGHEEVDIADYYALKVGSIWKGLKQESAAFWWLCIYFFIEYVRPQNIYPIIDILPYAQITLLIACISAFSDRSVKWVASKANILFVIFFIIVLLSSVFAFSPAISWEKIDIILNWVIIYFLIITVLNSEKRCFIFILLFLAVNFKMSQFGARDWVLHGFGYSKWGTSGAPGWFKDAGDLGIQMTIFVPLSIALILAYQNYWGRYKRLFLYLLPITGIATIVATSSRGAQLGMALALLWISLKNVRFKVLLAVILAVSLVYALLPEGMLLEYEMAGEDATSTNRLALWRFGLDVARDHPVLGVGYNNWKDYCVFKDPVGSGQYPDLDHCMAAHSTYITGLAEIGMIGLAVYLSLALFMFIENAHTRANARRLDNKFFLYTAHGLDAGLVAYMVGTVFFTQIWYPIFWIQLAITVALYEVTRQLLINTGKSREKTNQTGLESRKSRDNSGT